MKSRLWHLLSLLIILLIAGAAINISVDLWKDNVSKLGTIGFFVTLYGLIFTIIEVLRLNSVSAETNAVAEKVYTAVTGLISIKEITECQGKIESALGSLDEGVCIPSVTMFNIIKIYSTVFHLELKNDQSVHRKNKAQLESYCFNPNIKKQVTYKNSQKLREALISIGCDLAGSYAKTYSEAKF